MSGKIHGINVVCGTGSLYLRGSECFDPSYSFESSVEEFKELRLKYLGIQLINQMIAIQHEGQFITFKKYSYNHNSTIHDQGRSFYDAIEEYAKLKDVPLDNVTLEIIYVSVDR